MGKKKVLIIDDEKDVCEMVKIELELKAGLNVETAYGGAEGLRKFKKGNFDLVITDYNMPKVNGGEVLKRIKQQSPNTPVFVFSIYHDDDSTVGEDVRNLADQILPKPINYSELHEMITAYIN